MFFRNNEILTFQGENVYGDYARYNQLAGAMVASKVGEISVENFFRRQDTLRFGSPRNIELSLWRVNDRNVNAWERGLDNSKFVITKSNGERVSYVLVPRMNTDEKDPYPCEYTEAKDRTFEDINDPRVIVIARSYKGAVAEIAKDLVIKNEEPLRAGYKFLADESSETFCDFSNPHFLRAVTEQAVQMFEPNVYQSFQENAIRQMDQTSYYAYVDPIFQLLEQNDPNPNLEDAYQNGEGTSYARMEEINEIIERDSSQQKDFLGDNSNIQDTFKITRDTTPSPQQITNEDLVQ